MKGERLGEFEELLLLAVQALPDSAYVVAIQQHMERVTRRAVSLGAIYAGLDRLETKGLVVSDMGEKGAARGGKRKRLFTVTREGKRIVHEARRVRDAMWRAIASTAK